MGFFKAIKKGEVKKEPANGQFVTKTGTYKVLGTGCAKCRQLEQNTNQALAELGIKDGVQHISDMAIIAGYGVISTPALVIGEQVVSTGKVLTVKQITDMIRNLQ